jgi:hypothetical protein
MLAVFHVILEGDSWSTRTPVAIVPVLQRFANCAIDSFNRYVRIRIRITLSATRIHCMIAAADAT